MNPWTRAAIELGDLPFASKILANALEIFRGNAPHPSIYVQTTTRGTRMRRYYLTKKCSDPQVFLHEILGADESRHDHPWRYRSIILKGGYDEETPASTMRFYAGDVLERRADHVHRLIPHTIPTWTLFIAGPVVRAWRFMPQ